MGFVGFLRFSLLCLDLLAWPAFALVYPLWASIRAIETCSKYHMKKLVIYWTIFSLISLFEIFFVKLIEWVPFWPYIKLVAICWLVIPRFNGACHVYQHLIHLCLSINPQDIFSCCSIPKDKPYGEDSFLALAETYLKENGPKALEKLIASKGEYNKDILNDADALEVLKIIEPTELNVTAEEQLVEHPKLHLVESEKKEVAGPAAQMGTIQAESKENTTERTTRKYADAAFWQQMQEEPEEINDSVQQQPEFWCSICNITCSGETSMASHLKGRKHLLKMKMISSVGSGQA